MCLEYGFKGRGFEERLGRSVVSSFSLGIYSRFRVVVMVVRSLG